MTLSISETCNTAADLIERRGWRTGVKGWGWDSGALCVEGALMAALGVYDENAVEDCPAYHAVATYLGVERLWAWNDGLADRVGDEPEAAEQVIATLRAVAVIHAAREDQSTESAAVERELVTA